MFLVFECWVSFVRLSAKMLFRKLKLSLVKGVCCILEGFEGASGRNGLSESGFFAIMVRI